MEDLLDLGQRVAKECDAKLVFVQHKVLRLDEYLDEPAGPHLNEVQKLAARLRSYDGQIYYVELQWVWGNALTSGLQMRVGDPAAQRVKRQVSYHLAGD